MKPYTHGYQIKLLAIIAAVICAATFSACDDDDSYADLLKKETRAVNRFLADHIVIKNIPPDTVFQVGPDAPYYRLDPEGNLYMQVLDAGTKADTAAVNDLIYFRFTRYNLEEYKDGELPEGVGNENDMTMAEACFRYQNFQIPQSYTWGYGLQAPLEYLPVDCVINIIIKSQYGRSDETAIVIPYLYNLRYYRPSK